MSKSFASQGQGVLNLLTQVRQYQDPYYFHVNTALVAFCHLYNVYIEQMI